MTHIEPPTRQIHSTQHVRGVPLHGGEAFRHDVVLAGDPGCAARDTAGAGGDVCMSKQSDWSNSNDIIYINGG